MNGQSRLGLRVTAVAGGILLLVTAVVLVPRLVDRGPRSIHPPTDRLTPPDRPIPAEAVPYRSDPERLAVNVAASRREGAHPRTLELQRRIRAYPGAPPRVPHGLTRVEFREVRCNTCHARGGFAPRFGAYTPVTPHPELSDCLQCHAPDAATIGVEPGRLSGEDATCAQCHVNLDEPGPSFAPADWVPMTWPELDQRAMPESPPWIPHDLHMREDCLACHAGPSAVREIRTTHPERTDCRSCHVPIRSRDDASPRPPGESGAPFGAHR